MMIPRNTFLLSGQAVHLKLSEGFHNLSHSQRHRTTAVLRGTILSKVKKVNTVWSCTLFQQKGYSETLHPHIIKSPFKHLDLPSITLPEYILSRIEKFPKHVAIECGITGRKYTYYQLQKLSKKFAVSLLKAGLKPGQVVGAITPNCPEYPIILLGCLEAGLVLTPLNHVYTSDEIYNQLKDSQAVCIVSGLDQVETVKVAANKISESTHQHIKIIALDLNAIDSNSAIDSGIGRFSQLIADYVDESSLSSLRQGYLDPTELAVLPYSSGTTGLPKGVQLSHNNVVHNLMQVGNPEMTPVIETSETHQDVLPAVLPFYHIYGTHILCNSLLFGCKLISLPKFEPNTFIDSLKKKCSILHLVPPLVLFLGSSDKITPEHCKDIRWILSGAAPLGASDLERCFEKIPSKNKMIFVQGYGLTETSPVVSYPPRGTINLSTVGAPLSNTLVKIIDVENGSILGSQQKGEICVKGPQVMMGYLNNPAATASTIDTEDWFHTGDLGHCDDQGLLFITDRIKELIKVKAFQVPPAELEEVLRTMPGVNEVGVFGVPDEKSGEVPVAFIVKSSASTINASEVKAFMSKKVAPFKQLSDVFVVDTIPKTASGKILRREMVKMYSQLKQK